MAPLQDFGSLSAFLSGEPTLLRKDSLSTDVPSSVPSSRSGGPPSQHNAVSKHPPRKATVDGTMLNKKVAFKMLKQMGCQAKGGPAEGVEPYIEVNNLQQPVLFQMLIDFGYDPQSSEDGSSIIRVADRARRTPGEVSEALSRPKHRPERDELEALGEVGGYPVLPSRPKLRRDQEQDLVKRLAAPRPPKVAPSENSKDPPRFRSKDEEKLHLERLLRKRPLHPQDPVAPPPSSAGSHSALSVSSSASNLRNYSPAGASLHSKSPSEMGMAAPVRPSPRLAQAGLALLRKTNSSSSLIRDRQEQGGRSEPQQLRSASVAECKALPCVDHPSEAPRASSAPLPGKALSDVGEARRSTSYADQAGEHFPPESPPQCDEQEKAKEKETEKEIEKETEKKEPELTQAPSSSAEGTASPELHTEPSAGAVADVRAEPERPSSSSSSRRKTLVQQQEEAKQKEDDWLDRILGPPTSWPGRPRQSVKSKEEQAQHKEHLERLAKPRQRKDPADAADGNAAEGAAQTQTKRSPRSQREACSRLAVPRKPRKPPRPPKTTRMEEERTQEEEFDEDFDADEERWEEVLPRGNAQDFFPATDAMDFSVYAGAQGASSQSAMSALVAGLLAGSADEEQEAATGDRMEHPDVVVIPSALSAGRLSRIDEESRTEADAESVSGVPFASEATTSDGAGAEPARSRRRQQRGLPAAASSAAEDSSSRAARPYGAPVVPGLVAHRQRGEARQTNAATVGKQQRRPVSAGRQKGAPQQRPPKDSASFLAESEYGTEGSSPSCGPSPQALLENIGELYQALLAGKQAAAGILGAHSQRNAEASTGYTPPQQVPAAALGANNPSFNSNDIDLPEDKDEEDDALEQDAEGLEETQLLANIDRLYQDVLVQTGNRVEDGAAVQEDPTVEATPEAMRSLLEELLWSALMAARTSPLRGAAIEAGLVALLDVDFLKVCFREAHMDCLPPSLCHRLRSELPGLSAQVEASITPMPAGNSVPGCRWQPADLLSTLKEARDLLLNSAASDRRQDDEATIRPNSAGRRSQAASSRSRSSQKHQGGQGRRRSGSSSTDAEGPSGGEKTKRPHRQKKFAADHRRGRSRLSYWTAEDLALSDDNDEDQDNERSGQPSRRDSGPNDVAEEVGEAAVVHGDVGESHESS